MSIATTERIFRYIKTIKTLSLAAVCLVAGSPCFAKQQVQSFLQNSETASDAAQCYFIPPEGWEIADPKTYTSHVQIAFLKRTNKGFFPSINLAIEETQATLSDYLKAVKAIHEQDRNNHWRALGKVQTAAGLAQLTEIDSTIEIGPIRLLQLILIKEGRAYVLTAAALKEEFSTYYKNFQTAFRSLTLSTDLLGNIPQLERRENLKNRYQQLLTAGASLENANPFEDPVFQEAQWAPFQQSVIDNFADMGAFWQVLFLKNTQEKLLSLPHLEPQQESDRQNSPTKIQ